MDEDLIKIIKSCLAVDKIAHDIYRRLSLLAGNDELKAFWLGMSGEEKEHVEFWYELLALSRRGLIPNVFDDAAHTAADLENVYRKSRLLASNVEYSGDISSSFLLAYRMEFYLLHPAFETLFHCYKLIDGTRKNPGDCYNVHIQKFIDALSRFAPVSPEMELLGETLQHLWFDNKKLLLQSLTDHLTGLLNRRGFFNFLKPLAHLAQRNNANVGIMMIDIDHFKKMNDRWGHQKGDEILKNLAAILKENSRASDIVSRYGGEEFIVFLSSLDQPGSAYGVAEKIRFTVERFFKDELALTISIGLAYGVLKENIDEQLTALIDEADAFLYQAKENGRNKVISYDYSSDSTKQQPGARDEALPGDNA